MDKPSHLVELEHMVLGRHQLGSARHLRRHGRIERSTYVLLCRIRAEGPMTIGQLSDAFQLDASTLNRQTANTVKSGLLERIADPEGGMARKFRLTEEGERRLDEEQQMRVQELDMVFADWSPEDVATFAGWLKRFNSSVESITGHPWPRP